MSNLATTPEAAAPQRFANPLRQVGDMLAQPAVKRSLPLIFMIGLIAAAALAWSMLQSPPQRVLFPSLPDADKGAVTQALDAGNIANAIDGSGAVTVAEDDFHKARMLLAGQGLPKAAPGGYAILDQLPMGVSRAVEGERLRQARETELARSIQEIDTVAEARVHLATPEASVFVRDRAAPSASVIVKLQPGRSLSDAQVRSIINLVASSVPGMKPEHVNLVDQMGTLLSKPAGAAGDAASAGDARIDFQRRVEEKYRAQLVQLLTPLVGAGNFTAEVQADVDLNQSEATREVYDKQGAVRAEQGNWTGTSADAATPGGIPGALSNTAPPASMLVAPNGGPTPAVGEGATPGRPAPPPTRQTDAFARSYDLGKEVSVTRAAPGSIKRLSVAVLLREEPGKPRGQVEIRQINELVRAAVGYDQNRADQVTVVSRKFGAAAETTEGPAWYETGWFAVVARNVTAIFIALLVLLLGVRPLARALLKRRDDAGSPHRAALAADGNAPQIPSPQPVSVEMLASGRSYDDRVGLVRGFTRDNPARAALAVRDMIRSDGQ